MRSEAEKNPGVQNCFIIPAANLVRIAINAKCRVLCGAGMILTIHAPKKIGECTEQFASCHLL
jgi:hypothetical protein